MQQLDLMNKEKFRTNVDYFIGDFNKDKTESCKNVGWWHNKPESWYGQRRKKSVKPSSLNVFGILWTNSSPDLSLDIQEFFV